MDLSSARALMLACKSNAAQHIMLTCYKEEAKAFAQTNELFSRVVPEPPVPPVVRCRIKRGRGRCRGAVSELSITQMCAYHQDRRCGDNNVEAVRLLAVQSPRLFRLVFL